MNDCFCLHEKNQTFFFLLQYQLMFRFKYSIIVNILLRLRKYKNGRNVIFIIKKKGIDSVEWPTFRTKQALVFL